MGKESAATMHRLGVASEGKALLETDEIVFRGDARVRIPFRSILSVHSESGVLTLQTPDGEFAFDLGKDATAWERAIRNPRTLIDKLGIKAGHSVLVVGLDDRDLLNQIHGRTAYVDLGDPSGQYDAIVVQIERPEDLNLLGGLRNHIHDKGMIWAVTPKKTAGLMDVDVMAAAKMAGLVDVKVARVSDRLTALKLVVPVAMRTSRTGA